MQLQQLADSIEVSSLIGVSFEIRETLRSLLNSLPMTALWGDTLSQLEPRLYPTLQLAQLCFAKRQLTQAALLTSLSSEWGSLRDQLSPRGSAEGGTVGASACA